MASSTVIQVGTKGYLDTKEEFVAPLNIAIASVQDISKRVGTFSKTIKLPGTPNNNKILGFLFKVNVTDASFDPNIKEQVVIIKNGVEQFNGNMQLLSVNKKSPTFLGLDEEIEYEVAVKDDVGDFYSAMGDKFLETLHEFSGDTYDHTLTFNNVFGTSGNTADDVYKYFMTYHLRSDYRLPDFNLSVAAKAYWDACWKEEGYAYDWPELEDLHFHKLWIPYNGDRPVRDISELSFKASFSSDTAQILMGHFPSVPNSQEWYVFNSTVSPITVKMNDDATSGTTGNLFDTSNSYFPLLGRYDSSFIGTCEFKTRYKIEIYLTNPDPVNHIRYEVAGSTASADFTLALDAVLSGLTTGIPTVIQGAYSNTVWEKSFSYLDIPPGATIQLAAPVIDEQSGILNMRLNTKVLNFLQVSKCTSDTTNGDWCRISDDGPVATNMLPLLYVKFIGLPLSGQPDYNINYFKNIPSSSVEESSPIRLKDFIPKQIKRRDFISSIVKLYNLYISTTDNINTLKIETRDTFYNNGGVKNWTSKISTDDAINLKFLPDLQSKKLKLSYKSDSDTVNKIYTDATGEIYGQLEYQFRSEFTKDTKTIEPIFSPTPLIKNKFNLVVPAITDRAPKCNIRILYDGGNIQTPGLNTWKYSGETAPFSKTFDYYTYYGHLDNPYQPTYDIDFGFNDFMFYDDWYFLTDNNLYNNHYRRYLSQIESGKLLTAKFRLTELDILTLNLRDKIYVYDNVYYINKIIDYDCNSVEGLTTVELINVDEGVKFSAKKTISKNSGTGAIGTVGNNNSEFSANRTAGSTTGTYGSGSFSNTDNGAFNIFQPNTSYNTVNGQNNNVAGTANIVQGDGNNTLGSSNNIVGNNNKIG